MAYRYGERRQNLLFPSSIEEYVPQEAPVRVYDLFVDRLDFAALGMELNPDKEGCPQYDPRAMLKLLIYGYSRGIKSSRKLEQAVHDQLSFIWLLGGLKPDHKTIAEFRRRHQAALVKILKQCVRMCVEFDLIAGNILFVDGTKIRADAARAKSRDQKYYRQRLAELDRRMEALVAASEAVDREEAGDASWVALDQELASAEKLKEKMQACLERFEDTGAQKINQTDPDCALMHSPQGSHAAYNAQQVVDERHRLIVHADAVGESSDLNQLAAQTAAAAETLGEPPEAVCADAGYADVEEWEKLEAQNIKVLVPSQRQALHKKEGPFAKSAFKYEPQADVYRCPQGHILKLESVAKKDGKRHYRVRDPKRCRACPHWGGCTRSSRGRKLVRLAKEELKEKLEARFEEPLAQEIFRRRKSNVEHPFGHFKRNLNFSAFSLRGLLGAKAETALLAVCFNVARMITILGGAGAMLAALKDMTWV